MQAGVSRSGALASLPAAMVTGAMELSPGASTRGWFWKPLPCGTGAGKALLLSTDRACGNGSVPVRNRRFLFELPAAAACPDAEDQALDDNEDLSPGSFLGWALACATGAIPRDWRAPAGELVASWMPPNALTVRVGPLVRQGELVLTPDRWALSFPILPAVPAGLPAARRRCLEMLARDAQERWHMIRVGLVRAADGEALVAGLDLTGAPHSEFLFLAGLDGLRQVVSWLAEIADLLADVTVTCRSLEICRPKTENKGKDQSMRNCTYRPCGRRAAQAQRHVPLSRPRRDRDPRHRSRGHSTRHAVRRGCTVAGRAHGTADQRAVVVAQRSHRRLAAG